MISHDPVEAQEPRSISKDGKRINTFRIAGNFFDAYVFVLNLNSLAKSIFHVCVFISVTRSISAKSARYVYLIQNQWRSDFFTYVYVY